ncbi:MAG: hypothetical protein JSS57_07820 [Proteobacteria bacterium]|nr:hypothetical protein [Pseudomonadota bacterium]RTL39641.1 MAG: hypothetical protein EKK49_03470 [Rhodocyclaceae bacterium]
MLRHLLAFLLVLSLPAAIAGAPDPALPGRITEAALDAQGRCYRLIHHDTFAYEACLTGLLAEEKKAGPRRLGIEYFGFVGALNSARLGMLGAQDTAWVFLQRFRATQRKLRIDDASLCATVPGDCEVRIARMKLMEKSPPPPRQPHDLPDDGHRH